MGKILEITRYPGPWCMCVCTSVHECVLGCVYVCAYVQCVCAQVYACIHACVSVPLLAIQMVGFQRNKHPVDLKCLFLNETNILLT